MTGKITDQATAAPRRGPTTSDRIDKSDAEWQTAPGPEQYRVLREKGTDRAFTGAYRDAQADGVNRCAGCGERLLGSTTRFDEGTGWPRFSQPMNAQAVETETDAGLGMTRTEVYCRRRGSHPGHVFPDGPQPTGPHYCINSVSLTVDSEVIRTGR